jgi:peptidoglycan/LPS O-acetylase OafA/YrhL
VNRVIVEADTDRPASHRSNRTHARARPVKGSDTVRRRDIEGLRAVAILAVVLYHAGVGLTGGGYVGVDVFFVVSGFLITALLWRELAETGGVSFSRFYARRARRLLPASALVIVATVWATWRWLPPLQTPAVAKDGVASALYVVNYRLAAASTGYLQAVTAASPLQHYWSLSVEEQFYVLWPALVFAVATLGRRRSPAAAVAALLLVGVVSFAACVWLTDRSQPWAFFSLPTRAWEFVAGGLVALGVSRLRPVPSRAAAALGWAGLAAIVWSVVTLGSTTAFPGMAAAVPVLGTAAVLAAGSMCDGRGPARLLSSPPLQAMGRVSYSWYLWHWPVLIVGAAMTGWALTTWEGLGLVVAAGGLAALTTIVVENPVRYSRYLMRQPRKSLALAGGLTLTTAACAVAFARPPATLRGDAGRTAAAPGPITTPVRRSRAAGRAARTAAPTPTGAALSAAAAAAARAVHGSIAARDVPANLTPPLQDAHGDKAAPFVDGCFDGFRDTAVHRCRYGSSNSDARILLFGDSHATAWFPSLTPVADGRGWQLENLSKATCPPLSAPVWSPNFGRHYWECDAWRAAVLQRLAKERPMVVVLGFNRNYGPAYGIQEYGPQWLTGLTDMVTTLRSLGSRVVVIGPVPRMPSDVPDCLSAHLNSITDCEPPLAQAMDTAGIGAERAAVEKAGGYYLDVRPSFCDASRCAVIVGNLLVFRDQNHLTTAFATWLSPLVGAAIDDALARR